MSGIVYFLHRESPEEAAKKLWEVDTVPAADLPHLRSSSDIAWGMWNRVAGASHLQDIKYFLAASVMNKESEPIIIPRALKAVGVADGIPKQWPGTDVIVGADGEEGKAALALIGKICRANARSFFY